MPQSRPIDPPFSLQHRLTVWVILLTVLVWVVSTMTLFWVMHHESQQILDHSLTESGHVLVSLAPLTRNPHLLGQQALKTARLLQDEDGSDRSLIFQIWDHRGQRVYGSVGSGPHPILPLHQSGLHWVQGPATGRFRVYAVWDAQHRYLVQIAERWTIRRELLRDLGVRLLWTALLFVPVLLLGLHGLIKQTLASISQLALQVQHRPADDLTPIAAARLPAEVLPLIASFNHLLSRLHDTLEHERRFTADAAHELRTPLAAIRLHAQVLQRARSAEETEEALADIVHGVDRATRLTEQLLTLSRLDPEQLQQRFDPIELMQWIPECLAHWPKPLQALQLSLQPLVIEGDRHSLEILLRNLLDNASRYTPADGHIEIRCERLPEGEVLLQVLDDGGGIPGGLQQRIFDRFYRMPGTSSAGSGLGLSIVQRIIELHEARVYLDEGLSGRGLGIGVIFAPMSKSQ